MRFLYLLFLLLAALPGRAQVPNDNIENRRLLRAEEVVASTTTNCTLQWPCLNRKLAGQCIEYHNDQWFEFRPPADGTYYVNVGRQSCRDVRGVQLVALTGTPCQPATYRLLSCTSLGTQDDLYVPLPALRAGQPYLLEIDGYLHDFCTFTIQVSGQARGLPAAPTVPYEPDRSVSKRLLRLRWHLPDSLASRQYCRVLRREEHQFRSREVYRGPLHYDTLGRVLLDYDFVDTLRAQGRYFYQIVAEGGGGPVPPPAAVVAQRWITYTSPNNTGYENFVNLPLQRYPPGAYLDVVVTDAASGRLLQKLPLTNRPGAGHLYAQPWVNLGAEQVAVSITSYPAAGPPVTEKLLLPLDGGDAQ